MGGFADPGGLISDGPTLSDVGGSAPIDLTQSTDPITSTTTNFSTVSIDSTDLALIPPIADIPTTPILDLSTLGMSVPGNSQVTDLGTPTDAPTINDLAQSTSPLTASSQTQPAAAAGAASSEIGSVASILKSIFGTPAPTRVAVPAAYRPTAARSSFSGVSGSSLVLIAAALAGVAVLIVAERK